MSGAMTIQEAAQVITTAAPEELALASWFYRYGVFQHQQAPRSLEDCDFYAVAPWVRTTQLILKVMAPGRLAPEGRGRKRP